MSMFHGALTQLVTGLVLPGSSGSAVFDYKGYIGGVVFASGSRELYYALVVPYTFVKFFLEYEVPKEEYKKPIVKAKK